MSSLFTQALSVRSDYFRSTQEFIQEAVKCSKGGNNDLLRKILDVVHPLVCSEGTPDIGKPCAQAYPCAIYSLLKRVSKGISAAELFAVSEAPWEYTEMGRYRRDAIAASFEVVYNELARHKSLPHRSFSISDGDGNTLSVNATAVRLFCPALMKIALESSISTKLPADTSETSALQAALAAVSIEDYSTETAAVVATVKDLQKSVLQNQGSDTSGSPKYSVPEKVFPFIGVHGLQTLLYFYDIPGCPLNIDKLNMLDFFQALVAAKILEKSAHFPWDTSVVHLLAANCTSGVCCFPNYHLEVDKTMKSTAIEKAHLVPNPDKKNLYRIMSEDEIALYTYVLAASKSSLASGEENKDGLLSYFACLNASEVEDFEKKFLNDLWISPGQMMDLCKKRHFLSSISKYDFFRRIIVRPNTKDPLDLIAMQENEKLWSLGWKVMKVEPGTEKKQDE